MSESKNRPATGLLLAILLLSCGLTFGRPLLAKPAYSIRSGFGHKACEPEPGPAQERGAEPQSTKVVPGSNQHDAEKVLSEAEALRRQAPEGSPNIAIEKYTLALSLFNARGDHRRDVEILSGIASMYSDQHENRRALEFYERAMSACQDCEPGKAAHILLSAAFFYDLFGDKSKALQVSERALTLFRSIGDSKGEGGSLNEIGLCYWSLGQLEKAWDFLNQALPIRRSIGDREGESTTLHNLGVVSSSRAEFQTALRFYAQALSIERELADRAAEARTLNNMGVAYTSLNEFQKARECYDQALPVRRAAGDRRGEAYTLENIGELHATLGDYEEALKYYALALPMIQAVGDQQGEVETLTEIGVAYCALEDYGKALDYYDRALVVSRTVSNRRGEANALSLLGLANLYLGNFSQALDYYADSLSIRKAVSDRSGQADSLRGIGAVDLSLGKHREALDSYTQALSIEYSTSNRKGQAESLAGLARVHAADGDYAQAQELMRRSIELLESIRSRVAGADVRASYSAKGHTLYEQYIDLLMKRNDEAPFAGFAAAALEASERARARSLVESLAEETVKIREGVDAKLLSREFEVSRQLDEKEAQRARLIASGQPQDLLEALNAQIANLLAELQTYKQTFRVQVPPMRH